MVEGTLSGPETAVSGVPQGSVIDPLLFIVMMRDIDKKVRHSKVTSFADDTRISSTIHSTHDTGKLQQHLQAVYKWAYKNNMTFNSAKH